MPSERHQELGASLLCATCQMRHWALTGLTLPRLLHAENSAPIHCKHLKTDFGQDAPTPPSLGILVIVLGVLESWIARSGRILRLAQKE